MRLTGNVLVFAQLVGLSCFLKGGYAGAAGDSRPPNAPQVRPAPLLPAAVSLPFSFRIERPSAGVSAVRFALLSPTGQQTWVCNYSERERCPKAESWYVGDGIYTLTFSYRFEQGEFQERQPFPVRRTDEFKVTLWWNAGYGASVEVPSWVSAELAVRRHHFLLERPLQVTKDLFVDAQSEVGYEVRNISDRPVQILRFADLEVLREDGKWESYPRLCWRCGNTPRSGLPVVNPGTERVIIGAGSMGCEKMLPGTYRTSLHYTWLTPSPPRDPPAHKGILIYLEDQEHFRESFEYSF